MSAAVVAFSAIGLGLTVALILAAALALAVLAMRRSYALGARFSALLFRVDIHLSPTVRKDDQGDSSGASRTGE